MFKSFDAHGTFLLFVGSTSGALPPARLKFHVPWVEVLQVLIKFVVCHLSDRPKQLAARLAAPLADVKHIVVVDCERLFGNSPDLLFCAVVHHPGGNCFTYLWMGLPETQQVPAILTGKWLFGQLIEHTDFDHAKAQGNPIQCCVGVTSPPPKTKQHQSTALRKGRASPSLIQIFLASDWEETTGDHQC